MMARGSEVVPPWTRSMAFITLPFCLTGMADNWLSALTNDYKQSLYLIQFSFVPRFKPVTKHDIRLKNLEQQPNETIDEYISRAETMNLNKCFGGILGANHSHRVEAGYNQNCFPTG